MAGRRRIPDNRRHRRAGGRRSGDQAPPRPLVLLVDDDQGSREEAERLLSAWGCGVVEAGDGRDAIAKTGEFKPDVIIMDMLLPVMSGADAARRMKTAAETCTIPIIAVAPAAHHQALARESACDTLVDDYSPDALLVALRRFLKLQFTQ